MTDKELKELAKLECDKLLKSEKGYNGLSYQEFWAEGVKYGWKEKWHDLRKNSDDLPTESKEYWCKLKSGHYDFRIYYIDSLFYKSHWEELGIIAWCELPKFEEQ